MQDKNKKLLLVEDDQIIASVTSKQLENIGYIVHHVFKGELAIDYINNYEDQCNLILMDIDLGDGINGALTAKEILKFTDIPILFLSSHTEPEVVNQVENISSYGYVVKNTGITVLNSAIKMAFRLFEAKHEEIKAKQEIQENLERLELTLMIANDGMYEWDVTTNKVIFDSRYYTMAGYEPNEFPHTFDEWVKRVHPDDNLRVQPILADFLAEKLKVYDEEFRFLRKDGNWMWIRGKIKVVKRDENGKMAKIIGTHTDITLLKEKEDKLTQAQENAKLGSWSLDLVTQKITWSKEMYSIFGFPVTKEVPNLEQIRNKVYTKDLQLYDDSFKAFDDGRKKNMTLFRVFKNNKIYYISSVARSVRDKNGNPVQLTGTLQDVTHLKESELELKELRNYLVNIINSMPSSIIAVNQQLKISQWNSQAQQTFNIPAKDAINSQLIEMIPWLQDEKDKISQAIESKQEMNNIHHKRSVNGKQIIENIAIFPLISKDEIGAVIRIDDITKQVQLSELLVQNEKMMSVGGLAAGMAHEINNPLAGILQTTEVILRRLTEKLPSNDKYAKEVNLNLESLNEYMNLREIPRMLKNIRDAGLRAAEITANMLSFARKNTATFSSHNISHIIDQSIDLAGNEYSLKDKLDFRQIEIIKEYSETIPLIPCDPAKIKQVLLNIFKNGAHAMQKNENKKPQFIIKLKNLTDEKKIQIEVSDNGSGMNEETRKRIFEPFFTTKETNQGTGLGLSVSFFIISENHAGNMEVQSTLGKGTTFIIKLPFFQPQKIFSEA